MSYVAFFCRSKMSILINNWTQISEDLKENISKYIKVLFLIYLIRLYFLISNTYLLM